MGNMYEDKVLVNKILDGNKSAFSLLIKRYEKMVAFMVSRIVLEEADVKDVCQEVFIKVYLNLDKFKFDSKLSTWIATIAYRYALNHLKKKKRVSFSDISDEVIIDYTQPEDTPLQKLQRDEKKEYIHKMVNSLPVQYRTVITLYHLNDFSYEEIAKITGMPDGTVKSYLFRARKILKDLLKKHSMFALV